MLTPETDMPLKKYLELLEELGMDRARVRLLSAREMVWSRNVSEPK
jgi:hypothetical protein